MNTSAQELFILRELAREYRDIAGLEEQKEHINRAHAINDLQYGLRPSVLIDEIPWHEMDVDGQLRCVCRDPSAKEMESYFRRTLFAWKYFRADMAVMPYYPIKGRSGLPALVWK